MSCIGLLSLLLGLNHSKLKSDCLRNCFFQRYSIFYCSSLQLPVQTEILLADFFGCLSYSVHQNPAELDDWLGDLNPQSKEVIKGAYAVPSLASAMLGDKFQFERLGNVTRILFTVTTPWIKKIKLTLCPCCSSPSRRAVTGYFAVDSDSTVEELVFNRTVTLKDSYGKAGPK